MSSENILSVKIWKSVPKEGKVSREIYSEDSDLVKALRAIPESPAAEHFDEIGSLEDSRYLFRILGERCEVLYAGEVLINYADFHKSASTNAWYYIADSGLWKLLEELGLEVNTVSE